MRHRRSIRLKDYDYAQGGAYFVTICAHERRCLFGHVVDGAMVLNAWGEIVAEEWERTAVLRPNVELDAFVVMPNHVHMILVIVDDDGRGMARHAPTHAPTDDARHAPTKDASIRHAPIEDSPGTGEDNPGTGMARHAPTHAPTDDARHAPTHAPTKDASIRHAPIEDSPGTGEDNPGTGMARHAPTHAPTDDARHAPTHAPTKDASIRHAPIEDSPGTGEDNPGTGMARHAPTHAPTKDASIRHAPTNGPVKREFSKPIAGSLSTIVGAFKAAVTRRIHCLPRPPDHPIWQRNYYEHIIRTEESLNMIRAYIANNPARWSEDSLYHH